MAKRTKTKIKEDLLEQLDDKGAYGEHFVNLIQDYISFYEIKEELIKDIKTRGVSIPWDNGGGQRGVKKNDSLGELQKTNSQMLKILDQLGISTELTTSEDGDSYDDFFA